MHCVSILSLAIFATLKFGNGIKYSPNGYYPAPANIDVDWACRQNHTRGLYLPHRNLEGVHCCKEKRLSSPSPWISRNDTEEQFVSNDMYSFWDICQNEVVKNNDNDDLPTLMSKTHACNTEKIIGKPQREIDFKTFVAYRMMNYTNDSTVQQAILDANKECPEAEKETENFKKLMGYFWCFHRNEEKACNNPSDEAKEFERTACEYTNSTRVKETCPQLPKSVHQFAHCCRGMPTITPWRHWTFNRYPAYNYDATTENSIINECLVSTSKIQNTNGYNYGAYPAVEENATSQTSEANQTSDAYIDSYNYNDSSASQYNTEQKYIQAYCGAACELNPIIFKNGTTETDKMDWKFDAIVQNYYNNSKVFNTRMKTELANIVKKLKSEKEFALTYADFRNGTGKTLNELEKMYSEATTDETRVALYCIYYDSLNKLHERALKEYCGLQDEENGSLNSY